MSTHERRWGACSHHRHGSDDFHQVASVLRWKERELVEREMRLTESPMTEPPKVHQLLQMQQQLQDIVAERQQLQRQATQQQATQRNARFPFDPEQDTVLQQLCDALANGSVVQELLERLANQSRVPQASAPTYGTRASTEATHRKRPTSKHSHSVTSEQLCKGCKQRSHHKGSGKSSPCRRKGHRNSIPSDDQSSCHRHAHRSRSSSRRTLCNRCASHTSEREPSPVSIDSSPDLSVGGVQQEVPSLAPTSASAPALSELPNVAATFPVPPDATQPIFWPAGHIAPPPWHPSIAAMPPDTRLALQNAYAETLRRQQQWVVEQWLSQQQQQQQQQLHPQAMPVPAQQVLQPTVQLSAKDPPAQVQGVPLTYPPTFGPSIIDPWVQLMTSVVVPGHLPVSPSAVVPPHGSDHLNRKKSKRKNKARSNTETESNGNSASGSISSSHKRGRRGRSMSSNITSDSDSYRHRHSKYFKDRHHRTCNRKSEDSDSSSSWARDHKHRSQKHGREAHTKGHKKRPKDRAAEDMYRVERKQRKHDEKHRRSDHSRSPSQSRSHSHHQSQGSSHSRSCSHSQSRSRSPSPSPVYDQPSPPQRHHSPVLSAPQSPPPHSPPLPPPLPPSHSVSPPPVVVDVATSSSAAFGVNLSTKPLPAMTQQEIPGPMAVPTDGPHHMAPMNQDTGSQLEIASPSTTTAPAESASPRNTKSKWSFWSSRNAAPKPSKSDKAEKPESKKEETAKQSREDEQRRREEAKRQQDEERERKAEEKRQKEEDAKRKKEEAKLAKEEAAKMKKEEEKAKKEAEKAKKEAEKAKKEQEKAEEKARKEEEKKAKAEEAHRKKEEKEKEKAKGKEKAKKADSSDSDSDGPTPANKKKGHASSDDSSDGTAVQAKGKGKATSKDKKAQATQKAKGEQAKKAKGKAKKKDSDSDDSDSDASEKPQKKDDGRGKAKKESDSDSDSSEDTATRIRKAMEKKKTEGGVQEKTEEKAEAKEDKGKKRFGFLGKLKGGDKSKDKDGDADAAEKNKKKKKKDDSDESTSEDSEVEKQAKKKAEEEEKKKKAKPKKAKKGATPVSEFLDELEESAVLWCIHTLTGNLNRLLEAADDSDDDDEAEKYPFAWFRFDNWLKSVPSPEERIGILRTVSKGQSLGSCKDPKLKVRCLLDCLQFYTGWPNGMINKEVWGKVIDKLKGDKLDRAALRAQCKSGCREDAWEILLNHLHVVCTKAGRDKDLVLQAYGKTIAPDEKKAAKVTECLKALSESKSSYAPKNLRNP